MELGNQQERLAFLAGLVEGEGTITIQRSNVRRNGKHNLLPLLQVANSNETLVDFTVQLMRTLDVSPYVYWRKQKAAARSATVHVGGYKRCGRLLTLLAPYLVSKRPQAELVLAMCIRRQNLPKCSPYTAEDLEAVERIRVLNKKPSVLMRESSEAICRAPNVIG